MTYRFLIRRGFSEIAPFLETVRMEADSEREALGFLPKPAYAEAAQQKKLILLVAVDGRNTEYAGHLLFGGIFPLLRVRQICVSRKHRGKGQATTLLRALKSQGEMEGYLSIIANVAADLDGANALYEKNGFTTQRLKAGGATRQRTINVRILQLHTPNLISLMSGATTQTMNELIQPKRRSADAPIYAIDLNVFFDAIKERARSDDAGFVFEAALRHQIKIVTSDEFVRELERKSSDKTNDPVLSLARRIPNLPSRDKSALAQLTPRVTALVFPERLAGKRLTASDESDVLHLSHAIAAGAAGYITSDSKILSARDRLMAEFGVDIIGLSEFVDLIELPTTDMADPLKATKHFHISSPTPDAINKFIEPETVAIAEFLEPTDIEDCERICVSDDEIIGLSVVATARAIDEPSRMIVFVNQQHPFSSTVADYLISEQIRMRTQKGACNMVMLDIPSHPITRRMAVAHGFQETPGRQSTLNKIALGYPLTKETWNSTCLVVERLGGLKIQRKSPRYDSPVVELVSAKNKKSKVQLFDLETLLSPALFALPKREAVVVPINAEFAGALLGTDPQYTFLDVPEAQFLSRRTYFNTIRASRVMIRGSAIAFYESSRSGGRGAIVALGRIVEVTSIPVENIPEFMQRAAVVDDPKKLTKSKRVLVTVFDNLLTLRRPVYLQFLRKIGCAPRSNFVSATAISSGHLEKIVLAGFADD
jgi:GNAT superfamily N-acetyltransferase/predicted nucleic acid-binding protein